MTPYEIVLQVKIKPIADYWRAKLQLVNCYY